MRIVVTEGNGKKIVYNWQLTDQQLTLLKVFCDRWTPGKVWIKKEKLEEVLEATR